MSDIEFYASIIHFKDQAMHQISYCACALIQTVAYNTFEVNWSHSTQQEQLLPFKYVKNTISYCVFTILFNIHPFLI